MLNLLDLSAMLNVYAKCLLRPNKRKLGQKPVALCAVLLCAKVNSFMCDFQSILKYVGKVFNIFNSVWFILSHNPFPMGW